jgi:two-component system, cell cycle sensor histidine kinase and response regulator CckA
MKEYSKALKSRAFLVGSILKYQLEKLLKYDIPLNELVGFDEQCQEIINNYGDISYAMVVDLKGRTLFHSNSLEYAETITSKNIQQFLEENKETLGQYSERAENFYNFMVPVIGSNNTPIAAIVIGFPASLITHKTAQMVTYSVGVALLFLTMGGVSLIILLRFWVTNPLSQLLQAIMDIRASGTDSAQLLSVRTKDEFGVLGRAFNEMVLQLKESHTKIKNYTQELEFKVAESTAHLREANEKLQEDIQVRMQAEAALRESEEKYRGLIETTRTGYVIVDPQGQVLDANPEYVRLTGHTELEKILGRSVLEWTVAPDREKNAAAIKHCLHYGLVKNLELYYAGTDGRSIPVEINATVISASTGIQLISLVQDVTDRKQAEETLRKSEEQLQQAQKMEAVGKLAGGVAHDFNNILTAISGQSELLLMDLPENDSRRHGVQEIQSAADRATSLTRQLLAFSRKQIIQPTILDLNELIQNLDQMLRRLIPEDMQIVSILGANLGRVFADPGQIEQTIVNLAVNARDAMPQGGKLIIETANAALDVEYCQQHAEVKPGQYVMLAVSDTGIGINPETQSRIFEPFFTTKEMGRGTGLGLSMVYGIIKQNGGHIWVYSEPGHGTTFKIYLPRTAETREAVETSQNFATPISGSETILLVEDEDCVREITQKILRRQGYEVLSASSGPDAVVIGKQHQGAIDLILSDVLMRGMSGPETVGRLMLGHPKAKVIYMSGHTENAIVHHGVLDQGVAFIQKPFRRETLLRKVRELFDMSSGK